MILEFCQSTTTRIFTEKTNSVHKFKEIASRDVFIAEQNILKSSNFFWKKNVVPKTTYCIRKIYTKHLFGPIIHSESIHSFKSRTNPTEVFPNIVYFQTQSQTDQKLSQAD